MKLSREQYKSLEEFIYEYPTKHDAGFVLSEQKEVIQKLEEKYGSINEDKYWDAQMGITCVMSEDGLVIYHCDVLQSAVCGIENRDMTAEEWD